MAMAGGGAAGARRRRGCAGGRLVAAVRGAAGSPAPAAVWLREPNAFQDWLQDHHVRYRRIGEIVVGAALAEGVVHDPDLRVMPDVAVPLARIAVASRDDVLRHHRRLAVTAIQMPLVKAFFEHNFVKGLEAVYLRDRLTGGRPEIDYRWVDAFDPRYPERLPKDVRLYAGLGVLALHSVFRAFHEAALHDPAVGLAGGSAERDDAIAIAFHWAARLGAAMGREKLAGPGTVPGGNA